MALDLNSVGVSTDLGRPVTWPGPGAFRVDFRDEPDGAVLALEGEADIATAPLMTQALARVSEDGVAPVILDAAGLEFIDAYCLGVMLTARDRLQKQGRELVVRSPASHFRRLLNVLDMEDLIEGMPPH